MKVSCQVFVLCTVVSTSAAFMVASPKAVTTALAADRERIRSPMRDTTPYGTGSTRYANSASPEPVNAYASNPPYSQYSSSNLPYSAPSSVYAPDSNNIQMGMNGENLSTTAPKTQYTRELEERLRRLERNRGTRRTAPRTMERTYGPENQRRGRDLPQLLIQGDSLKTWSFASPAVERVQVRLKTEGRPLSANVELWQGPDNTPHRMRVYTENGDMRPFNCVILTPRGPNTIAVRNTGQMEFPIAATVSAQTEFSNEDDLMMFETGSSMTIQGGALKTYPFDPSVESVQVLIKTDGRPLNARVELLQGPNNNKQVIEVYTEDGIYRPFFLVIETPGSGNVVRVVNTSPVEFPMTASVEPYRVGRYDAYSDVVIGGDADRDTMRW